VKSAAAPTMMLALVPREYAIFISPLSCYRFWVGVSSL